MMRKAQYHSPPIRSSSDTQEIFNLNEAWTTHARDVNKIRSGQSVTSQVSETNNRPSSSSTTTTTSSTKCSEVGDRLIKKVQTSKLSKKIANYAVEHEILAIPDSQPQTKAVFGVPSDSHSRESWNEMFCDMVDFARLNVPKGERPVLLPPNSATARPQKKSATHGTDKDAISSTANPWCAQTVSGGFEFPWDTKPRSTELSSKDSKSTFIGCMKVEKESNSLKSRRSELFLFDPETTPKTVKQNSKVRVAAIPNGLLPGNGMKGRSPYRCHAPEPDTKKSRTFDGVIRNPNREAAVLTISSKKTDQPQQHPSLLRAGKVTTFQSEKVASLAPESTFPTNAVRPSMNQDHVKPVPDQLKVGQAKIGTVLTTNIASQPYIAYDASKNVSKPRPNPFGPVHGAPNVTSSNTANGSASAPTAMDAWKDMLQRSSETARERRSSINVLRRQPGFTDLNHNGHQQYNDPKKPRTLPAILPSYKKSQLSSVAEKSSSSTVTRDATDARSSATARVHNHSRTPRTHGSIMKPLPSLPDSRAPTMTTDTSSSTIRRKAVPSLQQQQQLSLSTSEQNQVTSAGQTDRSVPIMSRPRPATGATSKRFVDQDYIDPATALNQARKAKERETGNISNTSGISTSAKNIVSTNTTSKSVTSCSSTSTTTVRGKVGKTEADLRRELMARKARFEEKQLIRRMGMAGLMPAGVSLACVV